MDSHRHWRTQTPQRSGRHRKGVVIHVVHFDIHQRRDNAIENILPATATPVRSHHLSPCFPRERPGGRVPLRGLNVLGLGNYPAVGFLDKSAVATLGGTTSLLLLAVFVVVNVAVLVLRRDHVDIKHFGFASRRLSAWHCYLRLLRPSLLGTSRGTVPRGRRIARHRCGALGRHPARKANRGEETR